MQIWSNRVVALRLATLVCLVLLSLVPGWTLAQDSLAGPCADMSSRAAALNAACCPNGCAGRAPEACSDGCADAVLPFWADCGPRVEAAASAQSLGQLFGNIVTQCERAAFTGPRGAPGPARAATMPVPVKCQKAFDLRCRTRVHDSGLLDGDGADGWEACGDCALHRTIDVAGCTVSHIDLMCRGHGNSEFRPAKPPKANADSYDGSPCDTLLLEVCGEVSGPARPCLVCKTPLRANRYHLCFRKCLNQTDPVRWWSLVAPSAECASSVTTTTPCSGRAPARVDEGGAVITPRPTLLYMRLPVDDSRERSHSHTTICPPISAQLSRARPGKDSEKKNFCRGNAEHPPPLASSECTGDCFVIAVAVAKGGKRIYSISRLAYCCLWRIANELCRGA